MIKPLMLAAMLAAVAPPSTAQTVWRCGPDAATYTDAPCPGGREVAVADPRSPQRLAEARAVAARERSLALRLVDERHQREHEYAQRGSGLAGVQPATGVTSRTAPPKPRPGPARKRRSAADEGTSRAADHASRRAPG